MSTPMQADDIRAANRLSVFRALAETGAASRARLAGSTGLSVPTVAAILGELAAIGMVESKGREAATGGRPARRVAMVPDARHVLAVDLSGWRALASRIDLRGRVTSEVQGPALEPDVDARLLGWLKELVEEPAAAPVARLAVAVPGAVDPCEGRVDLAPALGWHDVDLAGLLERELGVPATLENDVNALALAELAYGTGRGAQHVLYVAIGSGIGAALVVDGRLVRGAHSAAGEIGYAHTPLAAAGAAGEAQRPGGSLEGDLLALARRFLGEDGRLDLGRANAREAFVRFTAALHQLLHDLACALDPELLVIAWPADSEGHLVERLRERWKGPSSLRIVASALGAGAAALGVGRLALGQVHEDLCRSAGRDASSHAEESAA
jgi:predicted NBD/HSP70 family sugar kinase